MIDNFEIQGHTCIAFEKLGDSLYTFLKENRFQPYQLDQIRHIAYQICYSLFHDNRIIHGDLKPENICLESSDFTYGPTRQQTYRKPLYAAVRLIDFGCAIDFSDDRYSVLQTRPYRAPEMVCGLKWNYTIDVWSIGCIIFELYTGRHLFPACGDDEHFEVMQEVLGPVPDAYRDSRFVQNHMLKSLPIRKKSCKPLKKCMHLSDKEHHELFNLLGKMLNFIPEERISLCDALKHPFFCHYLMKKNLNKDFFLKIICNFHIIMSFMAVLHYNIIVLFIKHSAQYTVI
ncbi:hypothetical protein CEXT_814231 [Caerostris extrusa]|uniref:Protein kinase domain-containing protein n=1 Tax=Caerostris extrusa TaxID=172846 RepID=A0AAV4XKV7_CAEEX|nr:hypothetical protein CEXT_814231 [Caerostris extrusa]